MKWWVARPVIKAVLRPNFVGLDTLPKTGGAIIAGNHVGAGDTFPVVVLTHRRIYMPAKKEFFEAKNFGGRLAVFFLRISHQVPIDTSGGVSAHQSLRLLIGKLKQGELVGIFPEGTRSPDGRLYRFHTGVAYLALTTGAPVYPMACRDTRLKRGFLGLPTMKDSELRFGEPMHFDEYFGQQSDPKVLRKVTDEIAATIQAMTGQTYVDIYASRVKHGGLTPEQADEFVRDHPGA